jgi:AraC-like DNA-binding protein
MYRQNKSSLYLPFTVQIQMPGYDLSVKYLEKLDESCVEFPHTHVHHEVYYILEGSLQMHLDGKEYHLLPNHFILIPPGMRHGAVYEPDKPKRYAVFVYGIHPSAETAQRRSIPENDFTPKIHEALSQQPYIIAQDVNGCSGILSELQRELVEKRAGWQLMLMNYCSEFYIKLLRNVLPGTAEKAPQPELGHANIAVGITKYMHEHYQENISLQDVSDAFHITPRHASRIFSEYFGTSFKKTLSTYRLNYAKNYLYHTDKTVEEIAPLVGISAPQTLYRLFKENEGMTVSEYRKLHKRGEL